MGGGREKAVRESGAAEATTIQHHVYCYLFTAFLVFLCLTCPPSECVLFSQLLVIEGGHKQTQMKAQTALVQRLFVCVCVCVEHAREINANVLCPPRSALPLHCLPPSSL